MANKLKLLDLFSGIGGFSLGLERTGGFETVAFCEYDEKAQLVLKKHWPDVPIFKDVRDMNYEGSIDVISGGYPCQPFSSAGKRQGEEDERHLWPPMFDLVKKHRPSWVIGENVDGHISMGLDQVLDDLEGQGYSTRTFIIPAGSVGAVHKRSRLWVVANSGGKRWYGLDYDKKERCSGVSPPVMGERCFHNENLLSLFMEWDASNPSSGRCRNDDGLSEGVDRLKQLGNAVVPQIPEIIGNAILAVMKKNEESLNG